MPLLETLENEICLLCFVDLATHIATPVFGPFGTTRMSRFQKKKIFFWTFMVQGKITEACTPTIWLGATPSGLNSDPPPSPPIFTPDALHAAAFPLYPGLGQAPNMLACIPGCNLL